MGYFEKMMGKQKMNNVHFSLDKGFWNLHPFEFIGNVSLITYPNFMIPNVGDFISLWYNNDWNVFRVTSKWYNTNVGQIEITVKQL